ncbi:MAG TPA: DUF952 domain-containing protein [Rhizomicrobium sp.]|jgi:uncharacterized protein (DUF952 family)|nr:DUF952 domain-containing protein [Rhizomicrobium sp.]
MSLIFKICPRAEWEKPEHIHAYQGSEKDRADGFLHFSTADQLMGTLTKYYADTNDLLLVAVNPKALGPELKYEPSRDGALFPHLYAPLNYDAVAWVNKITRDATGQFVLPEH